MSHVRLLTLLPVQIAAVRREVWPGQAGAAFRPALDQVWDLFRRRPDLRGGGHNIFIYHHALGPGQPMQVDFGAGAAMAFDPEGEVFATVTPAGEVASAVHVGPYAGLGETHAAIRHWMQANGRASAGRSWEVYGHWTEDDLRLETAVHHLLQP